MTEGVILPLDGNLIQRVIGVIAKTQHIPAETVTIDKTFQELKIDSLDGMNILFAVESEFDINIPDEQATEIRSVRQMVEGIARLLAVRPAGAAPAENTASPAPATPSALEKG
jgi:acyl carrier protein